MAKKKPPLKTKRPKRAERTRQVPRPVAVRSRPAARDDVAPDDVAAQGEAQSAGSDLIIVGVGASAGGLEAFSQLLQALPTDPPFAMILVQHLAPQHDSALPVLLSARTRMKVVQATEGMPVERSHVYVIPPNIQLVIENGHLHLTPRPTDRSQYTPVDHFLHSLAASLQDRAIAVILSGTASDGAQGIRETKAAGGITIAQTPESAKYDGMPRAAIATGLVDLVLSPEEIARELVNIAAHPLRRATRFVRPSQLPETEVPSDDHLEQIFRLLREARGVDFRRYKPATILRRLQRRMVLHKLTTVEEYLRLLREVPPEVEQLYQDILIHVTRFFREPDSFAAINATVLPRLLENRAEDQPIRVWVPGCSTGEEAYSIAIALLEAMSERVVAAPLQIFATDISEDSIDHARVGQYAESITADVSPERLRRFFTKVEGGYRVNRQLRDACVFARQDLIRDPPFSKLDLILCRNVLIYLSAELQAKLMTVFHYSLKPSGFLVLGSAETVGIRSDLFSIADKRHRIYDKKFASADVHVPFDDVPRRAVEERRRPSDTHRDELKSVLGEVNRLVQERYAPAGVILDGENNVVQFRGQTGMFFAPAPGDPSMNVFKMAREGLLHGLRAALQEVRRSRRPVHKNGLRIRTNGDWHRVDVEVIPVTQNDRPHFLVLFEDASERPRSKAARPASRRGDAVPARPRNQQVAHLQQELATSREYLQSIIQELEAANEELQSANEEVLSANEELQSTNEELDTAKEELQSTNEELNTVNDELHGRNDELSRLNSDLMNLLGSVQIAIVIVSCDLRIRRFTPMAERVLNLLPGDIGRPIGHLRPNIDCPNLEDHIARVIDTVTPVEEIVRGREGGSYAMRIRPYKNLENRIDGAVLALFNVEDSLLREQALGQVRATANAIVQTLREPIVLLDRDLRVSAMNQAFAQAVGVNASECEGRLVYELGDGAGRLSSLRPQLEQLDRTPYVDGVEVRRDGEADDAPPLILTARRIEVGGDAQAMISVALLTPAGGGPQRHGPA